MSWEAKRVKFLAVALLPVFVAAGQTEPDPQTFVPDVARAAAAEGNDAFSRGDYDAARDAYRQVIELAPQNVIGKVNLGVVEYRSGNLEEAERVLKEVVQSRIETGAAWLTLGILYYENDRVDEALAALSQATLHDPGNARAHNYYGVTLGVKGWKDGAEAELRRAVEIDPEYRDAHYNLALLYMERRPPTVELAKRHYYRSVELGAPRDSALEKNLKLSPGEQ
ncbi:MAG: tetratricopeptide repeat protein [Chthoniobacterales bacterium]